MVAIGVLALLLNVFALYIFIKKPKQKRGCKYIIVIVLVLSMKYPVSFSLPIPRVVVHNFCVALLSSGPLTYHNGGLILLPIDFLAVHSSLLITRGQHRVVCVFDTVVIGIRTSHLIGVFYCAHQVKKKLESSFMNGTMKILQRRVSNMLLGQMTGASISDKIGNHKLLKVRPRGWHLPEKHVLIHNKPTSGSLFDFGLFFYHNAKAC
ncbi:hypothetical protein ANCDUO_07913 [Ancylostoma duodenale]|uniref:malate synthase n=1 Tax=Ancylostoma duodenale TaxID=51022 RepID=A0A0C2GKS9_9BILA|nr:hypothetical protein ANCDUO_07913 [Ancylostoma duodenale]